MAHHQEDGDGAPLSVHVMWSAAGVLNSEIKSAMMLQREEHGWCASWWTGDQRQSGWRYARVYDVTA